MEHYEKADLKALKKEMEEMRRAYEEQIRDLVAQRDEKSTRSKASATPLHGFLKAQEAWLNEYVEVRLFKDNEKYKDDVYVAINGKNCIIRRGVWTRIRRKFALLLDQSEIQDLRTAELMEREAGRFADESRRRDV